MKSSTFIFLFVKSSTLIGICNNGSLTLSLVSGLSLMNKFTLKRLLSLIPSSLGISLGSLLSTKSVLTVEISSCFSSPSSTVPRFCFGTFNITIDGSKGTGILLFLSTLSLENMSNSLSTSFFSGF